MLEPPRLQLLQVGAPVDGIRVEVGGVRVVLLGLVLRDLGLRLRLRGVLLAHLAVPLVAHADGDLIGPLLREAQLPAREPAHRALGVRLALAQHCGRVDLLGPLCPALARPLRPLHALRHRQLGLGARLPVGRLLRLEHGVLRIGGKIVLDADGVLSDVEVVRILARGVLALAEGRLQELRRHELRLGRRRFGERVLRQLLPQLEPRRHVLLRRQRRHGQLARRLVPLPHLEDLLGLVERVERRVHRSRGVERLLMLALLLLGPREQRRRLGVLARQLLPVPRRHLPELPHRRAHVREPLRDGRHRGRHLREVRPARHLPR